MSSVSFSLGYELKKNNILLFCDVKGGINSNECENVSRKEEMSEEFEADAVESLADLPFATVDIKDDYESKYFIKYVFRSNE